MALETPCRTRCTSRTHTTGRLTRCPTFRLRPCTHRKAPRPWNNVLLPIRGSRFSPMVNQSPRTAKHKRSPYLVFRLRWAVCWRSFRQLLRHLRRQLRFHSLACPRRKGQPVIFSGLLKCDPPIFWLCDVFTLVGHASSLLVLQCSSDSRKQHLRETRQCQFLKCL